MLAVLIPLVVIDVLLPAFKIVALGFSMIGAYEMVKLYEHHKKYPIGVKVVIALSTALTFTGGVTFLGDMIFASPAYELISFGSILASIAMQLSLLVFSKDFDAADIGKTMAISSYVGFGVASLFVLRLFGVRIIIYVFLITILTDVFAYVFGMLFGKHKAFPILSPKKTWEGCIGGVVGTAVIAVVYCMLMNYCFNQDFSLIRYAVVCACGSVIAQVGDLAASAMKRNSEIKDYGKLIPGHGGVIDRYDSVIFVAPIVFYLLQMTA